MAVAMEVASWRGPSELGGSPVRKKRAWGADTQQLMQLMMGQLHHPQPELTLDLLGKSDPASAAATTRSPPQFSPEFLHLDPEDSSQPLPSGWEKCLDLQTGKLYYVNKSSGVRSSNDPRKETSRRDFYSPQSVEIELRTAAQQQEEEEAPLAHEFLGSKKSETESLKFAGCSSSSSESPARIAPTRITTRVPPSSSSRKKKQWSPHVTGASCCSGRGREEDLSLELDLNLAAGGSASSPRLLQTVCTMEMIQNALRRTSEKAVKREVMVKRLRLKSSVSSSFSSLSNYTALSEGSGGSPSTSSSSSASSRSGAGLQAPSSTGLCEAESTKVESGVEPGALVMGACTRCLMYVMLNKADPRCPRCDSKVPVDFAPPCKKQRGLETRHETKRMQGVKH